MWDSLRNGWERALEKTAAGLQRIWGGTKSPVVDWQMIEDQLLSSDIGYETCTKICKELKQVHQKGGDVQEHMVMWIAHQLKAYETQMLGRHSVMMFVGVNGAGKTTMLGKLAHYLIGKGKRVRVIAADTYRAGAKEQLEKWVGDAMMPSTHADPAAVVHQGLMAREIGEDEIVLIDTAGRLPHRGDLMEQMRKIYHTIQKAAKGKSIDVLLTMDANVGRHAHQQIKAFQEVLPVTGIIMNKLDGTARGGMLLDTALVFKKPIVAIGCGEGVEDWEFFDAMAYARQLVGGNELKDIDEQKEQRI